MKKLLITCIATMALAGNASAAYVPDATYDLSGVDTQGIWGPTFLDFGVASDSALLGEKKYGNNLILEDIGGTGVNLTITAEYNSGNGFKDADVYLDGKSSSVEAGIGVCKRNNDDPDASQNNQKNCGADDGLDVEERLWFTFSEAVSGLSLFMNWKHDPNDFDGSPTVKINGIDPNSGDAFEWAPANKWEAHTFTDPMTQFIVTSRNASNNASNWYVRRLEANAGTFGILNEVPEPSNIALFGFMAIGLAFLRRKKLTANN